MKNSKLISFFRDSISKATAVAPLYRVLATIEVQKDKFQPGQLTFLKRLVLAKIKSVLTLGRNSNEVVNSTHESFLPIELEPPNSTVTNKSEIVLFEAKDVVPRNCKVCDQPIPLDRLAILPDTQHCVAHSEVKPKRGIINPTMKSKGYEVIVMDGNDPSVNYIGKRS